MTVGGNTAQEYTQLSGPFWSPKVAQIYWTHSFLDNITAEQLILLVLLFGHSAKGSIRRKGHLATPQIGDKGPVHAPKKARVMFFFYLKRSFATLTPSIFVPLYQEFNRPHLEYAI